MRNIGGIKKQEAGVVLVVALLLLLVLTLIGVAASRGTILEQRMAGNQQDFQLDFQAAEAGLVDCEDFLNQVALPPFTDTNGRYQGDAGVPGHVWDDWDKADWQSSKTRPYSGPDIQGVSAEPRCVIEQLAAVAPPGDSLASDIPAQILMYRVTVQAWGASGNTVARLQTTYKR